MDLFEKYPPVGKMICQCALPREELVKRAASSRRVGYHQMQLDTMTEAIALYRSSGF
jgi:hypothetical protein